MSLDNGNSYSGMRVAHSEENMTGRRSQRRMERMYRRQVEESTTAH